MLQLTEPILLTFDEARHEYRHRGQIVPSVTQVLSDLHRFDMVPADILHAAQERGTDVHLACQYHDEGDLDERSLPPHIAGYLEGWKMFLAAHQPEFVGIERRVFHPALRYAGTADRFALIAGHPWVIDIKTSKASHPTWGMQTAAYAAAAGWSEPSSGWRRARRATVRLDPGGYAFDEWTDASDWGAFVSALTLRQWLIKHKLKGGQ